MLTSLDTNSQRFLNDLARISDGLDRSQRQISTGLRVNTVSDDPDRVSTILEAHAELEQAEQAGLNLGRVKVEVDTAEQALQSAVKIFDRVRVLGSQGASGTQTAATRTAIAGELGALLEQLVGISRTTVEGRFLFSGDADQQAPYTIDLTQNQPVSAYVGSAATRQVEHPNGATFLVAHTAQEIFDSSDPETNVFQSVNALREALADNDQAAIDAAVPNLAKASEHLNGQLAFYGAIQNKIAEAVDFGQRLELQLKSQLSTLQDADLSESILELNRWRTAQDAALSSWARLPRGSLFDFLS